ncbi:MAG: hypothetical protein ABIZ81_11285 [Opitutaceae bacterium]
MGPSEPKKTRINPSTEINQVSPQLNGPLEPDRATASLRRVGIELFLASTCALVLELALIRWLPGRVRVMAYFPNLVLIASFLGLGIGALARVRRSGVIGLGTFAVIGAGLYLSRYAFTSDSDGAAEHLWLLYFDLPKGAPVVNGVVLPIALIFCLTALAFVPLGGAIALRLQVFQKQGRPLQGYALDLLGSLVGVLVFLAFSAGGVRPMWWFVSALVLAFAILPRSAIAFLFHGLSIAVLAAMVHFTDDADLYSPYYALRVVRLSGDKPLAVLTNGSLHQYILDLPKPLEAESGPNVHLIRDGYRLPVTSLKQKPTRALVIGAGTGNDVAVLLEAGVPEIHAVEIDPAIIEIGRKLHPARPYGGPRVIMHNMDARAFLESTDLKFDLIIFGTLDSMTRLSALANVRLDNFVYTVESIRAARDHLTPDGGLALMFMTSREYIHEHLFGILADAFDEPPLVWRKMHVVFNTIYFAGPGFMPLREKEEFHDRALEITKSRAEAPTDDWPFLYLNGRSIPFFYFKIVGLVLATAVVFLLAGSTTLRTSISTGKIDLEMMLFGAAFLLVEASFVTEMNLLFGATWRTSAIVFAALLLALLIATLVAEKRRVDSRLALAGVAIALVTIAMLPLRTIAPTAELPRVLFAIAVCGTPILCAGLAFASRFAARRETDAAFGWNILGAVFGGVLELASMILGLRALFLIAAVLYLFVLWLVIKQMSANPVRPLQSHAHP